MSDYVVYREIKTEKETGEINTEAKAYIFPTFAEAKKAMKEVVKSLASPYIPEDFPICGEWEEEDLGEELYSLWQPLDKIVKGAIYDPDYSFDESVSIYDDQGDCYFVKVDASVVDIKLYDFEWDTVFNIHTMKYENKDYYFIYNQEEPEKSLTIRLVVANK